MAYLAQVAYTVARVAQRLKRWRIAAAWYAFADRLAPGNTRWEVRHATVLRKAGRRAEEAAVYERILARDADEGTLWWRLGNARKKLGDTPGAADAYNAAGRLRPRNVAWQKARAVSNKAVQNWADATDAYAALLDLEPAERKWAVNLAIAFEKLRDWPAATAAAERGLAIDASRPADHYRLGRYREYVDDFGAAAIAYAAGLEVDSTTRPIDWYMLNGNAKKFHGRRTISRFVEDHLAEIQAAVAQRPPGEQGPGRVFVYWHQGFDDAPPVVRACLRQLLAVHEPGVVVPLDSATISDWIDIPDDVDAHASRKLTQYSDLIRSALLARYGGVWIDSTALVTQPLLPVAAELTPTGFFAFRYRQPRIASWFMAADVGNYVIDMLLETQYAYWRTYDRVLTYFMFHDMLEALCFLDPKVAGIVDGSPFLKPNWTLPNRMREPYDADVLDAILGEAVAHKLTYKFPDADREQGTMLAHILEFGIPARQPSHAEFPNVSTENAPEPS